jgi:hypothetical protein
MARFNFVEDRDALPVNDGDDEERRGVVRDGEGVRVPLMFADGDENIRWITPQPVRQRVADSAPAEPAFDARWHQPGYRTFAMCADAIGGLTLDAAGDPAEAARAARIARQSTMWRDGGLTTINIYNAPQSSQEAGGGQVAGDDPDAAIETEEERANRERGGKVYVGDARDAYKARVSDAWRHNHRDAVPVTDAWQSDSQLAAGRELADAEARLKALMPQLVDNELAYQARKLAMANAWRRPEQPIRDNPAQVRGGPLLPVMTARAVPQQWNIGSRATGSVYGINRAGFPDAAAVADARESAYQARVARLEGAWREAT